MRNNESINQRFNQINQQNPSLRRTLSSRKRCFVCRKKRCNKRRKFYSVNSESIAYVYHKHKIVIDKKSVCCYNHLDENRFLTHDALEIINESVDFNQQIPHKSPEK